MKNSLIRLKQINQNELRDFVLDYATSGTQGPAGPAGPAGTPIATKAASGMTKHVWIAMRTDGLAGTGSEIDPFDGSNQLKFDTLMQSFGEYTTIHLGPGTFLTKGLNGFEQYQTIPANPTQSGFMARKGWRVLGSGIGTTTIKLIDVLHPSRDQHDEQFAIFYNLNAGEDLICHNFEVGHMTLDCNINGSEQYSNDWADYLTNSDHPYAHVDPVCSAFHINGSRQYYHDLEIINWGSRSNNGRENFVLFLTVGETDTVTTPLYYSRQKGENIFIERVKVHNGAPIHGNGGYTLVTIGMALSVRYPTFFGAAASPEKTSQFDSGAFFPFADIERNVFSVIRDSYLSAEGSITTYRDASGTTVYATGSNAISVSGTGVLVENCYIYGPGSGFYNDTPHIHFASVRGCIFYNCHNSILTDMGGRHASLGNMDISNNWFFMPRNKNNNRNNTAINLGGRRERIDSTDLLVPISITTNGTKTVTCSARWEDLLSSPIIGRKVIINNESRIVESISNYTLTVTQPFTTAKTTTIMYTENYTIGQVIIKNNMFALLDNVYEENMGWNAAVGIFNSRNVVIEGNLIELPDIEGSELMTVSAYSESVISHNNYRTKKTGNMEIIPCSRGFHGDKAKIDEATSLNLNVANRLNTKSSVSVSNVSTDSMAAQGAGFGGILSLSPSAKVFSSNSSILNLTDTFGGFIIATGSNTTTMTSFVGVIPGAIYCMYNNSSNTLTINDGTSTTTVVTGKAIFFIGLTSTAIKTIA